MMTRIILKDDDGPAEGGGGDARTAELRCQCGHVQRAGRFCDACGVMLSFYRAQADAEDLSARCPACGNRSSAPVCRNCGIKIPNFPGQEE